jgi:hypothetical protein
MLLSLGVGYDKKNKRDLGLVVIAATNTNYGT